MHPKSIEKIAEQLGDIARQACSPSEGGLQNVRMHDGITYSLPRTALIAFNELVGTILREKSFADKFSAKFIEKRLKTVLAHLIVNTDCDIEGELENLLNELGNYQEERTVFLKVEGISVSESFELGRVKFVPGDSDFVSDLQSKASAIIGTTRTNDEGKEFLKGKISKNIVSELSGGCVAVIHIMAEPTRAFETAKEEVRRTIDLLRFTSKLLYPANEDMRIGLKGDHPKSSRNCFVFSDSELHTDGDNVGSPLTLAINSTYRNKMDELGISRVSAALQKPQTNNFEASIIRSIHWFSVALTQDDNGNALVLLVVALESLFTSEHGRPIGGTVAESVAFLMSDTLGERKQIVKAVRACYSQRSGVAHGGEKAISDTDLATLLYIARDSILVAIGKMPDFSSQREFMNWIEDMKLS